MDRQRLSDARVLSVLPSPHQINWLRVDEDVPSHAVVTGSDLYIENLNKSYNGTYRCVASNTVGEAYDDYNLYVYGRYYLSLLSTFKGLHHSYYTRTQPVLLICWDLQT